jgi:hypothetical protein
VATVCEKSTQKDKNLDQKYEILATACHRLADQIEQLGQENIALVNLNAFLLREICLAKPNPVDYFSKLEAELGGLGEAIANEVSLVEDMVVSSAPITEIFERTLRQARDLLEKGGRRT